ncbi:chromate transporter [Fusobacterium gastrosuis]|uniref:chromate transporter n=2 Tax=Fusobacterium TaxID=848 RepID=UPI0025E20D20|nr:chromate transporter [uncultured Fusobacterium sp.]MDY5305353.1 chromate transporter [Fusobacterium gastrosuis]
MENKDNLILKIFIVFFKIGAFTIGGGYAMLSLIEDEIVNKKKWLSQDEFLEGMVIAQSTPGVLAVNISIVTGYKIAGYLGMFAGVLGSILPSFFIVLLLSRFLMIYRHTEIFIAFFNGLKPAVVALILISVCRIARSSKVNYKNFFIPLGIALIVKFTDISPIYIIIATMILGNIYFSNRDKKEKLKEDDAK